MSQCGPHGWLIWRWPVLSKGGAWLGEGKGRGVALLFVLCGVGSIAISAFALLGTKLAQLDESVEDASGRMNESAV
ncbi:hypothetical protein DK842_13545 [Chromobacterium phragmitis]|uniref:hypothetical protein n=1 Tax=Chromobacterium phragmitis TaxID=2202141 RepID=UPI000DEC88CC|nr:hypothetical protein [Chromobacterium phragmitis]AXE30822.1 hypothetical protein DK842_13545 [Chromobacterium phragmitis]